MTTVIQSGKKSDRSIPLGIVRLLPSRLVEEILGLGDRAEGIEEIRLRFGHCASLTRGGENFMLRTVLCRSEMDELVARLCDGSLYAHRDAIASGFLSLPDGVRVGICGRAVTENGQVIGIYDVTGLNIRLPHKIGGIGMPICRLLRRNDRTGGVLIYAPPGGGKTTLLRNVIVAMASGEHPKRVAVIDTRGELGLAMNTSRLCADILIGYPRGLGIEIATRTMNAELIVCDEIGDVKEAEIMIAAQNCGVPFVASTHARDVAGLLRRTGVRRLHEARLFEWYVGIRRPPQGGEFLYKITEWEDADGILQTDRGSPTGS